MIHDLALRFDGLTVVVTRGSLFLIGTVNLCSFSGQKMGEKHV